MRYPTVMISGSCVAYDFQANESTTNIVTSQLMPGMNTTTSASGLIEFRSRRNVKNPGIYDYKMTLGLGKLFFILKFTKFIGF